MQITSFAYNKLKQPSQIPEWSQLFEWSECTFTTATRWVRYDEQSLLILMLHHAETI